MAEQISKVTDDIEKVLTYIEKRDGIKLNESGVVEQVLSLSRCVHRELSILYQRIKDINSEIGFLSRRIANLESTKDPEIASITREDIKDAVDAAMKAYDKKVTRQDPKKKKWFK